jgi:hypothetical protein
MPCQLPRNEVASWDLIREFQSLSCVSAQLRALLFAGLVGGQAHTLNKDYLDSNRFNVDQLNISSRSRTRRQLVIIA